MNNISDDTSNCLGCELLRAEIKRLQQTVNNHEDAQTIQRLLELGDQRLLASDGPCGGQNAATALSAEESAELYQACQRIAS